MPLDWCRVSGGLRAKRNNSDESARGEEGKQHYDCEPFASDFKKDGDQDGHQRQYVSFSIDRRYRIICGVFRPAPAGRKTFAVPEESACRPKTAFTLNVVAADVLIGSLLFDLNLPPETAAATIYESHAGEAVHVS